MTPEDIGVFILGTLLFGLVMVIAVALAQYFESDHSQLSDTNRLERFIDTDDIVQNDIVFCRRDDVDRMINDGRIRFHAPMMGKADSIRHIECDVDEPVFLDSEDISKVSRYTDS
jgi:hypothetical protein